MTSICTNLSTLAVLNNAHKNQSVLGSAIERLGSGLRINFAKDGVSLAATAEGALSSINDRLQRVRELTIPDHGNGRTETATLVQVDNLEDHLISQNGDILVKTLNGAGDVIIYHAIEFDAQTDAGEDHALVVITKDPREIRIRQPEDALAARDRAMAQVDQKRSQLGAVQNRLECVVSGLLSSNATLSVARSRIMDAEYAVEVSRMTRSQIVQQAGIALLAQANQVPQGILELLQ